MLTKNSATATRMKINVLAGAVLAPLVTYVGAYFFQSWTPVTGMPPNVIEPLISIDNAPKTGGKIPEGLDLVKAKFYRGEKTYKLYAAMVRDQGAFTTNEWWVLA